MLDPLRRRNHLLPVLVMTLGLGLTLAALVLMPPLAWVVAPLSLLLTYLELITQWSFRAPAKRKPVLAEEDWNPHVVEVEGVSMHTYHRIGRPNRPTLWMCHGWTAASQRMVGRLEPFLEDGWSVVMVDLPNHGGSGGLQKWTAEQSCTLVIGAVNVLTREQPRLFHKSVFFYGHSMGGFIGLRLSKRREELMIGDRWSGWILESPMTGYTEIFDETCNLLRVPSVLRPWLLSKTLRHVHAINGEPRLSTLAQADVPAWGMPAEPVLLIQADPDERLGPVHHERLIEAMASAGQRGMLSIEKLPTLRHSGAFAHEQRENLVRTWIRAHSSSD